MYERGLGVPQDFDRARMLYRIAAGQGHKEAAEHLVAMGGSVPTGTTVPQLDDFTTARGDVSLSRASVAEIQRLLSRLDFDPGPADGVAGRKTVDAIAKYQAMANMTVDGKPSAALLDDLREIASTAKR
jgi:peptidoglycan hydrolase-like protein with peptidoglycan-binding domain